jgi:hypothetical protein
MCLYPEPFCSTKFLAFRCPIEYLYPILIQVPSFPAWFNIIYDDDPAVYTYHRLDSDEENADLQILV